MPFQSDDFFVGMIAYFTVNDLRRHGSIRTTNPTRDNKPRPFVCYAQAEGDTYWTAFTGTPHPQRRMVDGKWLRLGAGRFMQQHGIIIADGRSTFVGPIEGFAELSEKHDQFNGLKRPFLMAQGVEEVRRIVSARGGLTPPSTQAVPAPQRQAA